MKNFNTLEMCIAFFVVLISGIIAGVALQALLSSTSLAANLLLISVIT